jgi:hypothetical protein
VGLLSVVLGDFMLQDIQCREAILPGASAALVVEGITPGLPSTLHNLATPSTGELGARDVSIECRSSAIVPSIPNWRGRVHYVAEADDDLGDELSLLNIIHWLD